MIFNATEVMTRLGIKKIEQTCGRFVVLMDDGRVGFGDNAEQAFTEATGPDAQNVRRAA